MRGTLTGIIAEIPRGTEVCEILLERDGARLERIVSAGFISPQEEWMDQSWDEWVALLQGSAALELEGEGPMQMGNGDWVFLPAHTRHRVASTSTDPPCVWLAVHLRRAG
jgi:cupin 2 domain-containing protein